LNREDNIDQLFLIKVLYLTNLLFQPAVSTCCFNLLFQLSVSGIVFFRGRGVYLFDFEFVKGCHTRDHSTPQH